VKTSLSFGAGVQTTALLVLIAEGKLPRPDAIIFADTGTEQERTYRYLEEVIAPYAKSHGLEITALGPDWRSKHYAADLESYCRAHRMVPGTWVRWCTDQYKVRPILRYLKKELGATKTSPVESWIGISTNESHRATKSPPGNYQLKRYPLIEMGLSRDDCQEIITAAGLPAAPKSGCWFCPFQSQGKWHQLKREEPALFERALFMEANAQRSATNTDKTPIHLPIFGSLQRVAAQEELPGFDAAIAAEGECVTGSCFV